MEIQTFAEYKANGLRHQWELPLPYELWTATSPITNREISGENPPTIEEQNYKDFAYCAPRKLTTCMWIIEPIDIRATPKEWHTEHFLEVTNRGVSLIINDGDDTYQKKDYTAPYEEAMRQALEDAELLRLASSYLELVRTAYAIGFNHGY